MGAKSMADLLVNTDDEDIELIKELFKATPEYGEFILSKKSRIESILDELAGIDK